MTIDPTTLTARTAHEHLVSGDFTAHDLVQTYLSRAHERNGELNAYLEIFDDALIAAEEIDARRARGEELGPLAGIPIAMKDNILIKGKIASSASKILENYHATYDATVIEKLKAAGAVIIGRTNMDEFAMGGSTENSAYGPTKNPHDTNRVSGGSSGGSAVAVADHLALLAIGSDTGGSIRQPAAFCGVVGMKPSYGRVSRSGLMAMASSLDQIGPFGKTVEDTELLYHALIGPDARDATTVDPARVPPHSLHTPKTIGVPRAFIEHGVDAEIMQAFEHTLAQLKERGYTIVDIALPNIHHALAVYYVLMPAEVSSNLARFDGVRYGLHVEGGDLLADYVQTRGKGFGPEAKRRIMLGTYVLSSGYYDAYYGKACAIRRVIRKDFEDAFAHVDTIMLPTTPSPAFKIGEKTSDPLQMYLEDVFTVPANVAELPAISVPAGSTTKGLPIGVQIIAPYFVEDILFTVAKDAYVS